MNQEIRSIEAEYSSDNMYNQDESGLFYRWARNRTYRVKDETRWSARGSSFQKYKERLTVVFRVIKVEYKYCLYAIFVYWNHLNLKSSYTSQRCGFMDTTRFEQWIEWWYSEVKERSNGPLLDIDNCSGYFFTQDLPGVRIEKLPSNTRCKFQPLEKGLIAQSKISYRSLLLWYTSEIEEKKRSGNHNFKNDSRCGLYYLIKGLLPHVADAIQLFHDSWNQITKATVLKCWIKSKCFPAILEIHTSSIVASLTETCINLVQDNKGTEDLNLSIPNAVEF